MAYLGVVPGAVTPFGLINDRGHEVRVVIDAGLLAHDPVNVHPLTNDRTTAISPRDLLRFIEACGHQAAGDGSGVRGPGVPGGR